MQDLIADFLTGLAERGHKEDPTTTSILDATFIEVGHRGLAKASMDAIAKRAGVNRVTIYRRFKDRDGLLAAWAYREGVRMALHLASAIAPYSEPEDRLREGFVAAIRYAQEHPFIRNTARDDPSALIEVFRSENAALLQLGGAVMATEIRTYQHQGRVEHLDADAAGEAIARLVAACVLIPGGLIDADSPAATRAFAKHTLVPMILGHEAR